MLWKNLIRRDLIRLKEGQAHEFILEAIQELPTKTDIKVIVHGFLGNRFHTSIIPLRNGK